MQAGLHPLHGRMRFASLATLLQLSLGVLVSMAILCDRCMM